MSDRNLRLQVILSAVDKLTRPFKGAQAANKRLAETLKQSRQQLRDLNQQAGRIDGFRKTKQTLLSTQQAYRDATDKVAALARALQASENPTKSQITQFERAKKAAAQFKEKTQTLSQSLQRQRDALHASGISTSQLGQAQRRINTDISRTNNTLSQQRQQLERLEQREKKLAAAKSRYQKTKNLRNDMLGHGAGMVASGGAMLMGVKPMLNEASIYHKEMSAFRALGVGEDVLKDADKFASGMRIIGNSASDNLKILKEAHSVLRHYDEAKMVTPELLRLQYATRFLGMHGISDEKAQEMRDQSQEVLKIAELRNMINNPDDFKKSVNLSAQAMAASGGLVLPSDYMAMLKTGNVAAKQMSDEAFYFSMSHIIQQIGGDRTGTSLASAYQNLMMGRTTQGAAEELNALGLLQKGAVKYGKTGHITKVKPGALVNAEKFQTDPFRYLMDEIVPRIRKKNPQLDERGMETAIAKLFSNRKGADLFVTMYREHANIEKQIKAGHEAYSVDKLVGEGKTTAQGQELELDARKRDLYKEIGDKLLPIYIKGLEKLSEMLTKVKRFFNDHPTVAKYVTIAATGLGIILVVMGSLTLVLATLLGPLAMIRLGFSMLGINGAASVLKLGSAFSAVGKVLSWLRVLVLTNPLLLIIGLIALGAYLIWKNWDKLGPWFKKLWDNISNYVSTAWASIKQKILSKWAEIKADILARWDTIKTYISNKWHEIVEDAKQLPGKFKQFGADMIEKLINGIKEKWKALKQNVTELGAQIKDAVTPDFVKEQTQKSGVKQALDAYNDATRPHANPLAAFSGAHDTGGYIPAGKFGLVGEYGPELINGPARVTSRRQTATLARMAAAALSMGASTVSAQQAPLHPYSLPAAQYQSAGVTVINQHQRSERPACEIHIHPTPAQSAQDIAQAVAREMDRREQQQRARARSAFADREEY
ncbi:phage tail tape measure protein [Xenorhabdus sp. SF857]|uniref:phage tail tape measure protein n=1 Tax=Xenorhabdus bakwenae TaxID=3026967 RepID=UPI002557D32C|nr:phage tail tape measure protein [Xenorhabdus sp. SF857]WFQ80933.1 phage tail tape measure protein [Xenorhabdus sp. SF857]